MQCLSCNVDNPISAKFCSSCGTKVITDDNIKSPDEVSINWLIGVLRSLDYKIKDDDKSQESFVAYHDKKANLFIELKSSISVIGVMTFWGIQKPGLVMRPKYLSVLNKANKATWLCTFTFAKDMDELQVSGYIFITEKLSNRDIASFLDKFNDNMHHGFDSSGLRDLA